MQLKEADIPKKVPEVTSLIERWAEEFYHEETRANTWHGKVPIGMWIRVFSGGSSEMDRWGVSRQTGVNFRGQVRQNTC